MGREYSGTTSYHSLLNSYLNQTTTHGVRKISSSRHLGRRVFWIVVFLSSLGACSYHCSYLIMNYSNNPKATITRELDAESVDFPSLTVCNLNVIKKEYAHSYFELASVRNRPRVSDSAVEKGYQSSNSTFCYQSEAELLQQSAIDLSDTWLNLGVTKDNLSEFGHRAKELIIQCTYNSKDCYDNGTIFRVEITNVTSPTFGLCHTISVKNRSTNTPASIKKGGTTQGIRLTLNIERSEYWDLISSEYGVRLLVHPQGTYPTLQRGGIIASPGRSVHIGVKRKVTNLLPGREGSCTETFLDSKIIGRLEEMDLDFDLTGVKYTFEHCNTLCQNTLLFDTCGCLDEQPRVASGKNKTWRFCNPCNKVEAKCRSIVLRSFTDSGNICDEICKPSCSSTRYDITLSKADWPNLNHQQFVMNRSFEEWMHLNEAMGLLDGFSYDEVNTTDFVNDTFFRENLLRVHVFIEEMIFMLIEESYSYTLPKLMADLGGCLGLYLGVSVISIMEFLDLCGSATLLCLLGNKQAKPSSVHRKGSNSRKRRRNKTRYNNNESSAYSNSYFKPSLGYFKKRAHMKSNFKSVDEPWRNSAFSQREPYYPEDIVGGKNMIRRF